MEFEKAAELRDEIKELNHGYRPQNKLWGIISLLIRDNSANKFRCTSFRNLNLITLRFAGSIPLTLQTSRSSFSASVIDSICKLQCTLFLKLGSHYNIVPLSFARGIIQLTDITALRL